MFQIVLFVISIALAAAVATASTQYIPIDAIQRQSMRADVITGLRSLDGTVTRYLDLNRDAQGKALYPGDGINLLPTLAPAYGFVPSDVKRQLTWQVTAGKVSGLPAVGICLRPISNSSQLQRDVLSAVRATLPVGSSFLGVGCNQASHNPDGDSLTYWIVLSHLDKPSS